MEKDRRSLTGKEEERSQEGEVDRTFFTSRPKHVGQMGSLFHSYIQAIVEGNTELIETIKTEAIRLNGVVDEATEL
ncbi:MAG: hypothetical protein US51_C0023G0003 [Microgenomates group bacterium GW2011_GWA2_37_6]|nr:MAG: hypothetical protein US51_C0023G0003 [Microgenomates group bacterium GW2011_GWA2_37_6]